MAESTVGKTADRSAEMRAVPWAGSMAVQRADSMVDPMAVMKVAKMADLMAESSADRSAVA